MRKEMHWSLATGALLALTLHPSQPFSLVGAESSRAIRVLPQGMRLPDPRPAWPSRAGERPDRRE